MHSKKQFPLVSIIINNYNYGHFLKQAIDSALNQTYSNLEVIVVDDGSIDNSREIIASYGNQIFSVNKENGGQASAFNAGFASAHGDIIFFLDSDDIFCPNKVQSILNIFQQQSINDPYLMLYHILMCVDQDGLYLGYTLPSGLYNFPSNIHQYICKYKYLPPAAIATSSIVISKDLAQKIFPIPEQGIKTSADEFIVKPALLFGRVYGVDSVLGKYRVHGENNWYGNTKIKTKDFLSTMEKFLNTKLKDDGKKPVISFFDSIYAREYYIVHNSRNDLFILAFKVIVNHVSITTFIFFLKTLFVVLKMTLSIQNQKGVNQL